MDTHLYFVK